jgi:hypothetical protein
MRGSKMNENLNKNNIDKASSKLKTFKYTKTTSTIFSKSILFSLLLTNTHNIHSREIDSLENKKIKKINNELEINSQIIDEIEIIQHRLSNLQNLLDNNSMSPVAQETIEKLNEELRFELNELGIELNKNLAIDRCEGR